MGLIQQALVESFTRSNGIIDYTVSDLAPDQLHYYPENSTLGTPASIYFHVALAHDAFINKLIRGEELIFVSENWSEQLGGLTPPAGPTTLEWARSLRVNDLDALMRYANRVRENTNSYVAALADADLEREVNFYTGPTSLINVLMVLQWEIANHTGEIAALRGMMGLKGLPF